MDQKTLNIKVNEKFEFVSSFELGNGPGMGFIESHASLIKYMKAFGDSDQYFLTLSSLKFLIFRHFILAFNNLKASLETVQYIPKRVKTLPLNSSAFRVKHF